MKNLLLILLCLHVIFSSCEENETQTLPNNIYGCTDMNAYNYNSNANTDDGSCVLIGLPQHISGIQLGEFHLGGTVFYLDSSNNLGMIFKGYNCQTDQTWPQWGGIPNFLMNFEDLGTDTIFGSGISNTQILYDDSENHTLNTELLYDEFSRWRSNCLGPGTNYPFDPPMFLNGNVNTNGWYIPSLAETRKIYEYGIMPHWDTVQFPNDIRGWGHQYISPFGGIFYSSEFAGGWPHVYNTIYTSSEAAHPNPSLENEMFFTFDFSDGTTNMSLRATPGRHILFGVRNFYYNP